MLYTEESRIGALAVHIVGNKAKDEPLMVSPSLSDQLSDAALMQTLLAYFIQQKNIPTIAAERSVARSISTSTTTPT